MQCLCWLELTSASAGVFPLSFISQVCAGGSDSSQEGKKLTSALSHLDQQLLQLQC